MCVRVYIYNYIYIYIHNLTGSKLLQNCEKVTAVDPDRLHAVSSEVSKATKNPAHTDTDQAEHFLKQDMGFQQ